MNNGEIGSLTTKRSGSGPESWAEHRWHSEATQLYPPSLQEFQDLQRCIKEYVQSGQTPANPILSAAGNVVTIGSCFAAELRHFLTEVGLSSNSFWVPSGLNNTFALKDFLSWVATGEETSSGYRYERKTEGEITDWKPDHERSFYRNQLANASALVLTLGLAEVWEDVDSGEVFWRGIPESVFDEQRHSFRLSSVSENIVNIHAICKLFRSLNPKAPLIVTLSPVPLKATFGKRSCVTADCVSKSTLRVAINEVVEHQQVNEIYYWPSFEIIKWLGCHLPYPVYGTDDAVVRHVSRHMVLQILERFVATFYGDEIKEQVFRSYMTKLEVSDGAPGQPPFIYQGQIVKA